MVQFKSLVETNKQKFNIYVGTKNMLTIQYVVSKTLQYFVSYENF